MKLVNILKDKSADFINKQIDLDLKKVNSEKENWIKETIEDELKKPVTKGRIKYHSIRLNVIDNHSKITCFITKRGVEIGKRFEMYHPAITPI